MNQQKWKDFITNRSTIWTLSLCIMGVIVLGGAAAIDNSRNTGGEQTELETDASLPAENASQNLTPTGNTEDSDTRENFEEASSSDVQGSADNLASATSEGDAAEISDNNPDTETASDSISAGAGNTDASTTVNASGTAVTDDNSTDGTADSSSDSGEFSADNADETAISNNNSADDAAVTFSGNGEFSADNGAGTTETANITTSEASATDNTDGQDAEASATGNENTQTDNTSGTDTTAAEASSSGVISEQVLLENNISFDNGQSLLWPSAGTIAIDYSMDKSVYFQTLNQYKYNPALIISSETGNQVLASAKGIVESISIDEETGTTLVLNIGNGYLLTYGQLKEPAVSEGDVVEAGDLLAYVSEPTRYYSAEGSNLYFKMTKDGTPVDPVLYLE